MNMYFLFYFSDALFGSKHASTKWLTTLAWNILTDQEKN